MTASAAPPPRDLTAQGLSHRVVQGPIQSFPGDVGWFTAYRKPLEVHARRMNTEFILRRDGDEDRLGKPGDYIVVVNDGQPVLIEGGLFDNRYDRHLPIPPTSPAPVVDEPWSEERKGGLRSATAALVEVERARIQRLVLTFTDEARGLIDDVEAHQKDLQKALDEHPTAPQVYACPFCIVQGLKRDEIKEHVLKDHLMKGLFGGQDPPQPTTGK